MGPDRIVIGQRGNGICTPRLPSGLSKIPGAFTPPPAGSAHTHRMTAANTANLELETVSTSQMSLFEFPKGGCAPLPRVDPPLSAASASRSLAMICSGVCFLPFIESSFWPKRPVRYSHIRWHQFWGADQSSNRIEAVNVKDDSAVPLWNFLRRR